MSLGQFFFLSLCYVLIILALALAAAAKRIGPPRQFLNSIENSSPPLQMFNLFIADISWQIFLFSQPLILFFANPQKERS
jgi:peptidoglycan/LPS O-acetylase OafA/YrhL